MCARGRLCRLMRVCGRFVAIVAGLPFRHPEVSARRVEASGRGRTIGRCSRESCCRGWVVEAVSVETFIWTDHALLRLSQRRLDRLDVEEAIRINHDERRVNDGQADWLVHGITPLGLRIERSTTIRWATTTRRYESCRRDAWRSDAQDGALISTGHVRLLRHRHGHCVVPDRRVR